MLKKLISSSIVLNILLINTVNAEEKMPINATAGQCFTKSFYPPKVTKTTRIVSTKRVKLSDSTVKYKVIPAEYTWHQKRIKISDEKEKIIIIPATYKNIRERVLITATKKVWQKSLDQNSQKVNASCIQAAKSFGFSINDTKVGTCYYEHYQAAKYITSTEKILASEASKRIITTPATYKTITKKIVTSNSTMKLIPVPIKYKKVKEDVTIEPARSEWKKTTCENRGCNQSEAVCLVEIPRTFKTVTKKVILKPAIAKQVAVDPIYTYVKAEVLVTPATTQEINIPATYKTISKTNKIKDEKYFWSNSQYQNASTRIRNQCNKICLIEIPAVYKTVKKKIVATPASSKKVITPEKYTIVKIRKVSKAASFKTITVPAEFEEIRIEKERTTGFAKWTPMVCESAMVPSLVKKVKKALKFQGYYSGEINGDWSFEAKNAVREYQKAKGLSVSKLSIETMKSLGIY